MMTSLGEEGGTINNSMRYTEIISEATQGTYKLYHGSDYENIETFRFENIRQRTGTPGTLSFTTDFDTAKIYGKTVYEVEVSGNFGDYLDADDVERNFKLRWPAERKRLEQVIARGRKVDLDSAAQKMRSQIAGGEYQYWEGWLWHPLGWDGSWTFEHGARNLIVGPNASVTIIGVDKETTKRRQIDTIEQQKNDIVEKLYNTIGHEEMFEILNDIEEQSQKEPDLLKRAQFELSELKKHSHDLTQ